MRYQAAHLAGSGRLLYQPAYQLGGTMGELFRGRHAYSALSIAYAVAAVASGFVPLVTDALGDATANAWWHPGVVLAALSIATLVGALAARSMRKLGDEEADVAQAAPAQEAVRV